MEKLPMCRVCLAENVRMYIVVNKNLRELYEKLTDNPFVTKDSRPMLACFFCSTKLKQCYQFQRKCLEAEELFTQMMNEDYEPNSVLNQDHPVFHNGFIQTPIQLVSIVGECETESVVIKEELVAVYERQDDIFEPKEEHQSDGVPTAKKPKLHPRRINLEDVIAEEQMEYEQLDTTVIQNPQNCMFTTVTKFKETLPYTTPRVANSRLDIKCRNDSNNEDKKCKISSKYTDSDDTNRHPRLCVKEKPLKCDICQRCFINKSLLIRHIRTHTGEKPYECDICRRSFIQKSNLTIHIRTHTGEKPFKCDVCQRCFSTKSILINHIRTHTGKKLYKCDICSQSFYHNSRLMKHMLTHVSKKFKCDTCQRCFREESSLIIHIRRHTGEKPYKCDICQCSFILKKKFTSHIRMHAGEKPFKCDVCQRYFSTKPILIRHIRTHTGEKPYKCDICQRNFTLKSYLKSHSRTHTGEKPYKCNICSRSFNCNGYLTKHIRTHTGEKPYKCDICQRSFTDYSNLLKHIRTHSR